MKKVLIFLIMLLLCPVFVFAEDNIVVNVNNLEEGNYEDLMYNVVKTSNGYVSFFPYPTYDSETDTYTTTLWIVEYDDTGYYLEEISPEYESDSYFSPAHSDAYLVSDEIIIMTTRDATISYNPNTNRIVKENTALGCRDLIGYGDNILCVGDYLYYYENGNNKLTLIDENLNVIKQAEYDINNEVFIAVTTDDEYIYALFATLDETTQSVGFEIRKINSNLKVVKTTTIDIADYNVIMPTIDTVELEKIGNSLYYVNGGLHQIDLSTGKYTTLMDPDTDNREYTSIEETNGYIVLTGLIKDGDAVTAIVDIYDKKMKLQDTISLNKIFDYSTDDSDNGETSIEDVRLTQYGFYVTGLLGTANNYASILSEFRFPWLSTYTIHKDVSDYYELRWILDYSTITNDINGINDVLELSDGIIAVGGSTPYVYRISDNGAFLGRELFDNKNFKTIFEVNNKNYAITSTECIELSEVNTCYSIVYEINAEGELVNPIQLWLPDDGYITAVDELIFIEGTQYLYAYALENDTGYLRINKDFSDAVVVPFADATELDKQEISDLIYAAEHGIVLGEFKNGFVYIDNSAGNIYKKYYGNDKVTADFVYYKDGKEVWSFEYTFYPYLISWPTMIVYEEHIIISLFNKDYDAVLLYIDENGKILEENIINQYYDGVEDYYYFKPEHVMEGEKGFYLSGWYFFVPPASSPEPSQVLGIDPTDTLFNEIGAAKQEVLMYFSTSFNITSETDKNGTIDVISEANSGDVIIFDVMPNKGYKLKNLTVVDEDNKAVTFTENEIKYNEDGTVSVSTNKFTMPTADVHIVAHFEKTEAVPDTSDNIMLYAIILIGSVAAFGALIYRRNQS